MDREQLIRDLRKIQDDEYMRFGNVGDKTHGKAADMLEHDDLVVRNLEADLELAVKKVVRLRKRHKFQLLTLTVLNLLSHLALVTFITYTLVKAKVWTWPLF